MSKKQKKHLLWWIGLFILPDRALMPTTCETDAGFHYDSEPVKEFDYRNRDEFIAVLSEYVRKGNPKIPAPSPEQVKQAVPVIQARIKAKSWKEVERRSIWFSIECFDDEFRVTTWGRAPDGTWGPNKETVLDRSLPVSAGISGIVDVILEHLSQRSDLPGLPITRTA